jgi:hypothetical protein
MAESKPSSEIEKTCKTIQNVSAIILKQLRKGCLCSVHSLTFAKLVKKSFEIINNDFPDNLDPESQKHVTKTLLSFFSCLRTLIKVLIQLEDSQESEDSTSDGPTLCKQFHEWILILVRSYNNPESTDQAISRSHSTIFDI